MPYADPEKNRECRRRYKLSAKGRLLAKERRRERAASDPAFNMRARANERSYTARNPEKIRAKNARGRVKFSMSIRNSNLRKLYGITHVDYERMLTEQQGCCAICGTSSPGRKNRYFSIDHDHLTNKIRQLLCTKCNTGLGSFKDDLNLLRKAAAYLEAHLSGAA